MAKHTVFNHASFRIIGKAKNTEVKVKSVPREHVVIFDVEGMELLVKKDHHGCLKVNCPCDFCGAQGVANGTLCRRRIAVYWWLIRREGIVSEVDIEK